MRHWVLMVLVVIPGVVGVIVFGAFALLDYVALRNAYAAFEAAAQSGEVVRITVTEARQNIFRLNLFADGVWTLLSALIAAIGLHGLCASPQHPQTKSDA